MAALTVQDIARAGLTASFTAAAGGGDTIAVPTGAGRRERTFLWVKNGGGGSINVTVTAQITSGRVIGYGTFAIANTVVAVPAGQERAIGPFTARDIDASGNVVISYSAVTSVTVAAISLPAASY